MNGLQRPLIKPQRRIVSITSEHTSKNHRSSFQLGNRLKADVFGRQIQVDPRADVHGLYKIYHFCMG